MPTNSLLLPIVLPGGDIQFASASQDATAQDVISELLRLDKVKRDILGDLSDSGWALQKFRVKDNNPIYQDGELSSREGGIIPRDAPVAPFLPTSKQPPTQRHFSLFPTTGHLHSATLRLVSLHPLLRIHLSFLRVPNIHDSFEYDFYISRTMTVDELVKSIIQELGLSLSAPTTGKIDYEIEQSSHSNGNSSLPQDSVVFDVLSDDPSPDRSFTFCVPEGWYLRPNPRGRNISGISIEPSEATLRQLADLQESDEDEDDEDEGTAKGLSSPNQPSSPDWRKSYRISNIFEWLPQRNSVVSSPSSADNRKSVVSEPLSVEHHTGNGLKSSLSETTIDEESDLDETAFEEMLNDLGLKDSKREDMYNLSSEQKRYLLRQNRGFKSASKSPHRPSYASYGPSSGAGIIPRLMPQLTGDALMKRFSLWGGEAAPGTSDVSSASPSRNLTQISPVQEEIQPLQPQTTGGLWSSFWTSSGGEKKSKEVTVKSCLDNLKNGRSSDARLTKHLISLRVQFSTSPLAWSHQFIEENGLEVLESLLMGLVAKGGKKRVLADVETNNLFEIVKCIRHVLNTEIGFQRALSSPTLITHITYALHTSSPKLRAFVSELLAAACMISVTSGHKAVLAAFSDYRIEFDEAFRFESLLASLRLPDMVSDGEASDDEFGFGAEEESIWTMRASAMALVNALTMCPDSIEDRVFLRDEFSRRGLNEIIVGLRYVQPPESLKIQLNVYTEEKLDDETEMRNRATNQVLRDSGHDRSRSDSEAALEDIILLAKQHGELYPMMMDILNHYAAILQRDINMQLKGDLLKILDKIVEQAALLDKFDDNWHGFMKRFASSVKEITGQEFEVRVPSEDNSMVVVEQELEALRAKVEELSDERTELRNELNQQIAEINTLKSLPLNLPGPHGKAQGKVGENFHGLVQRLVAKEKYVLDLQIELDRLKAQNPSEGRDADDRAKRDRERSKWNTLMDEIAKLKTKNSELEQTLNIKDKDVLYLKRAMESVYTRFISREETREEIRVANMDAELMATKAIESLARKDDEIASLVIEVAELKAKLAAKPMTEKEFKMRSPPPPPPPPAPKPKRPASPARASDLPRSPPPIAPPPPSSTSSTTSQSVAQPPNPDPSPDKRAPPPPPPPPPPAPPMRNSSIPSPPVPPPMPPGIPPPPPPMPMPPSSYRPPAPAMPGIRPGRKLKPFFWDKLTDTSQSVWNEATFDFTLDLGDLETTFAIDKAIPRSNSKSTGRETNQTHTLLPGTRATNIGVLLSRVKIGPIEIRKALIELDDGKLSVDDLKGINKQLPTTEEIASYKSFGDDVSNLSKADQFCYQLMSIPRLHERVSCMVYRRKLESDIGEIRPELDFLHEASKELRDSVRFKRILQSVLVVGNALNGSTFRGGARGFQLDALLKMRETKTSISGTGCPTLMHYLARVLLRSDPKMLNFIEDMPHLEAAGRVSVQTVMQSVTSMVQGLAQAKNEVAAVKKLRNLPASDQFVHIMQPFVDEAEPRVNALQSMSTLVDQELRGLLAYYGEKPDSPEAPKPEDFFGMILSFSSSLQKCALEMADKMETKKPGLPTIKTSSEESTLKAQDSNVPVSQFTPESYGRSIGRGDLDQAIRSMRDGKRRARPQNTRPLSKIFVDGGGARQSRIFN